MPLVALTIAYGSIILLHLLLIKHPTISVDS